MPTEPLLAHSVLFTLKDNSDEAKKRLVASCKKYLTDHRGTVFFAAGTRATDIRWPVSDQRFDVALLLVFQNKAAHDEYQDSPRHQQFLEENEANWAEIRVLDAYVES
ncbi:MAG: Dabb family protein [Thermoguttaceae bacterium]|jgi:hypothetical protein|nr:Dabb family protein [Thermoguttaceae bacterium]